MDLIYLKDVIRSRFKNKGDLKIKWGKKINKVGGE